MVNVITAKVTYQGCDGKIWREIQISSNAYLCQLGYTILATFDTMAYHLFSISFGHQIYELPNEDHYIDSQQCLFCVKLSKLGLKTGDKLQLIYDFGCEQTFIIEITNIAPMPKGCGRAYPKVLHGEGVGIIDDITSDELFEIIQNIDKDGSSVFYYEAKRPSIMWDYRAYDITIDNALLKGEIEQIAEKYAVFKAYLDY